jgi:mono/diheme cytochrome c family protein
MWARRPVTPAFIGAAMLLGVTTGALADGTGWFSPEQVNQGRWEYSQKCSVCHGAQLQGGGAPAVKGQVFEQQWNGKTLKDFYNYVHDQLPLGQAGSLDGQEYANVVAFMLAQNDLPSGNEKLTPSSPMERVPEIGGTTGSQTTRRRRR